MNYAKALAVGVATGLLAVVLEFVVGIVSMMVQTAAQAGDGGGITGFSVNPVPSFIIGFVVGFAWMLWKVRLRTQTR